MAQANDSNALMSALRALSRQVIILITGLRVGNYRPGVRHNAGKKLTTQLRQYIKQTPTPGSKNIQTSEHDQQRPNLPFEHITTSMTDEGQLTDSGSSSSLEAKLKLQTSAGEKLMQSTWEHLRASIRCAKAGDKEAARLHASIMDSALKEAAHFLDDQAYQEFVQELGKELASQVAEPVSGNFPDNNTM